MRGVTLRDRACAQCHPCLHRIVVGDDTIAHVSVNPRGVGVDGITIGFCSKSDRNLVRIWSKSQSQSGQILVESRLKSSGDLIRLGVRPDCGRNRPWLRLPVPRPLVVEFQPDSDRNLVRIWSPTYRTLSPISSPSDSNRIDRDCGRQCRNHWRLDSGRNPATNLSDFKSDKFTIEFRPNWAGIWRAKVFAHSREKVAHGIRDAGYYLI